MPRPKIPDTPTPAVRAAVHRADLLAGGGLRADIKLGPEDADKARRLMAERGIKITGLVAQLIREARSSSDEG